MQSALLNQSRICGKGVGLGLFPSDSLESQLYEFIEIAHIDHTMVLKMIVEIFVRIVWTVFAKIKKSRKTASLTIFGLILAMFLTSQPYEFNEIAHKGP